MAGVEDLVSDRSKLQKVRENTFDAFIAKQAEYEKDMQEAMQGKMQMDFIMTGDRTIAEHLKKKNYNR